MKKRISALSLLLILVLSLLLSACSFGGDGTPISLDDIPAYSGEPYVKINSNRPFFTSDEITTVAFEDYSHLDPLRRCGVAIACIGKEIMPTEERGNISSVTPSGWVYDGRSNNRKYDGEWLYNRCHLIGHQLAGEDDNERNLITGTRYLNIEGMLPFENQIAAYVKETGNHVMLRVTPIYDRTNIVASGVLMEGYSVEDSGDEICFCIYAYNVQPGVEINYFTGDNRKEGDTSTDIGSADGSNDRDDEPTYVLNKSSEKYHLPNKSCSNKIKESNRIEYFGAPEDLTEIYPGYEPCGTCKPDKN